MMRSSLSLRFSPVFSVCLLALGPTAGTTQNVAAVDAERSALYEVAVGNDARRLALLDGFDVLGACSGHVAGSHACNAGKARVVTVGAVEAARLFASFPQARLIGYGRPFKDIARERRAMSPLAPDANYYTNDEIASELLALEQRFPAIAQRVDLQAYTQTARTHEGRTIWALKVSLNVLLEEDEPQTLIASQHHARELGTPHMTLRAAQRVLEGYATDPALQRVVRDGALWFVPTVNPDGVEAVWNVDNLWRKNRLVVNSVVRGVDLNRNYPFRWGVCGASTNVSSQTYRGPTAGSEPETRTMMALARKLRFEKYLDFHSHGRDILDTYSPCTATSYPGSALLSYQNSYRDRLAQAAQYAPRPPSASGEAPEWHWAESGTMSFLVEIGTAFQPPFTETVAEEARVWPAVLDFLQWVPPVRGRVRSLRASAPLEATLLAQRFAFVHGEATRTAASGRMHLWVPQGVTNLKVDASGHDSSTVDVTAPDFGQTTQVDIDVVPTLPKLTLTTAATLPIGNTTTIDLDSQEPGREFWMPLALATTPATPIGPRHLDLAADALFWLSAGPLPGFYSGHLGKTDAQGRARATFSFPREPAFVGFRFYFAALTFEAGWPLGVRALSPPVSIQLVAQ